MTFDIGLHEVCVRVGVLYVITKFSRMDSLPNFLTHGAPLRARFARARSSAIKFYSNIVVNFLLQLIHNFLFFLCMAMYAKNKRKNNIYAEIQN